MKLGPFALLPSALAITEAADIAEWELHAQTLFSMQRWVPWWLGDMVVFGEAQFGDDFWQVPPLDASEGMLDRFAGVARKYPPEERCLSLSFTHHQMALRIKDAVLRRSLLRVAERDQLSTEDFGTLIKQTLEERNG